jgi:hypothetical protein
MLENHAVETLPSRTDDEIRDFETDGGAAKTGISSAIGHRFSALAGFWHNMDNVAVRFKIVGIVSYLKFPATNVVN